MSAVLAPIPARTVNVSPRFDAEPVAHRIGLVLLATDHTSERDFNRMIPANLAGVYGARIEYANPVTADNLRAMAPRLTRGAALILPDETLDVVVFSCTSASIVIGDAAIDAAIGAAKPGAAVVTPVSAAREAFGALGVRRLSILTPYTEETSVPVAEHFAATGFDVASLACLGLDDDRTMARISPRFLIEAAERAVAADAEALFISCTALRAAEVAAEIEVRIGRPVVTSNQASIWRALACCGLPAPLGFGRLMALTPAGTS